MTTNRKGNVKKTCQKHQNLSSYKINQKFTDVSHLISTSDATGICKRCHDIICWKLKYNKYKPLTVPKRCSHCMEKCITRTYYTLCRVCSEEKGACAKCQAITAEDEFVGKFPQTQEDKVRELNYLNEGMKHLRERERRTLMREMQKNTATNYTATTSPTTSNATAISSNNATDNTDIITEAAECLTGLRLSADSSQPQICQLADNDNSSCTSQSNRL